MARSAGSRSRARSPRILSSAFGRARRWVPPQEKVELMVLVPKIVDQGITVFLIEHDMKVVMGVSRSDRRARPREKIAKARPSRCGAISGSSRPTWGRSTRWDSWNLGYHVFMGASNAARRLSHINAGEIGRADRIERGGEDDNAADDLRTQPRRAPDASSSMDGTSRPVPAHDVVAPPSVTHPKRRTASLRDDRRQHAK